MAGDAGERIKNDIKKIDEGKIARVIENREKILNECYEMLANLKTVEFGDKFEPSKKPHLSLEQFKKSMLWLTQKEMKTSHRMRST